MFDLSPLSFTPPQRPEPSEDRSEMVNTPTACVVETVDWVAAMKTTKEGGDELSVVVIIDIHTTVHVKNDSLMPWKHVLNRAEELNIVHYDNHVASAR